MAWAGHPAGIQSGRDEKPVRPAAEIIPLLPLQAFNNKALAAGCSGGGGADARIYLLFLFLNKGSHTAKESYALIGFPWQGL
jgi:hypothetical protein